MITPNEKVSMSSQRESSSFLTKLLKLITTVYPKETLTAFLLTLNIFLLLAAYYIIKPVREALFLGEMSAELKSYISAASAVLLIFVVKAFSAVASKFPRQKLITWVTLFFISNLVIFYLLSFLDINQKAMGIAFFLWVAVFNVMVVAQFWGFANDIYTEEAGKRLFPLIAFGATFGGFSGATIAGWLVEPFGLYQLMLVAGGVLGVCIALTWIIHKREVKMSRRGEMPIDQKGETLEDDQEKPLEKGGGFRLVFKKRYLLYIAFFVLLLNFINTNGEYILGEYVKRVATELVEAGKSGNLDVSQYIGIFYADFMKYFNLLAMFIQLFVVSRLFKWIGVRGAIFVLPFIAMGGYSLITIGASLMLVKWVKVAENGTDYSLMNTTRHALFLITSREEKYKAKAAIDTFFHRAGDVFSAFLVFFGTTFFMFRTSQFAGFNVALCIIWIIIGVLIAREHKKLSTAASLTGALG
jgi:AAA family ATP:ADP antiporter